MAASTRELDAFEADFGSAFGYNVERITQVTEDDWPYEVGPALDAYVLWHNAYSRFVTDGWRIECQS